MALPPPPAGLDIYESQVPRILATNIATVVFSTVAIGLRFLCRRLTKMGFWWDDWLMLPALLLCLTNFFLCVCYSIPRGLGRHIWILAPDAITSWVRVLFIGEMTYVAIMCAVKCSILCFYWRLFNTRKVKLVLWALGALVALWGVAMIFLTAFQCTPPNGLWDRFNPDLSPETRASFYCGENPKIGFLSNAIPNIFTDVAILILPVPLIWNLKLAIPQKVAISGVFLLGIFVTAVSITRCVSLSYTNTASPDITWTYIDVDVWTVVECNIAIVCACLPSLRPLLNLAVYGRIHKSQASGSYSEDRASSYPKGHTVSSASNGRWGLHPNGRGARSYTVSRGYSEDVKHLRDADWPMSDLNHTSSFNDPPSLDSERQLAHPSRDIFVRSDIRVQR